MLFLWLVLLQLVIFAVLVVFLRVVLKQNVTKATTHLHALNEDYTQKLDDARKQQMEAEKYYDEMVLKSKIDVEKNKVQVLKEAHDTQEAIVSEARKQSADILEQANKAKDSMLGEVDTLVEERAVQKACELIQEILPSEASEEMHSRWVAQLLDGGLDELARLNLPEALKKAEVVSAFPLKPAEKKALAAKMKEKLKREFEIVENCDAGMISGLKITLGTVVIDGSLRFKIREMTRLARNSA